MRNMMRNGSAEGVLKRGYLELADENPHLPHAPGIVPELMDRVRPSTKLCPLTSLCRGVPPRATAFGLPLSRCYRDNNPKWQDAR
jgi:NAD-reducing hydrogenase small subunit